jgi:uncharacterized protein (DUF983 family)
MALVMDSSEPRPTDPAPQGWPTALRNGFARRCPSCGRTKLFERFLRVAPQCASCGLDLAAFRSDDAPPYFTIVVVGHIVVPSVLMIERLATPPIWMQLAFWIPTTLALTLWFLPRIKGAVIGAQFAAGIRR